MQIILDQNNSLGILAVKIWIKEGSSHDEKDKKGAHHLLGSLLSRGCGPYSHINVAEKIEGNGASLRCETYEDGLLISLKCYHEDAKSLLPIIGWMIAKPHINSDQLNLELELAMQALLRKTESPLQTTYDGWRRVAYGDGPYGHDPLGSPEDLKRITKNDLHILSQKIKDNNIILSLSGNFKDSLLKDIESMEPFNIIYNKLKTHTAKGLESAKHKPIAEEMISLEHQETEQVIIMIGNPTIPYWHESDIYLRLLSNHLGCGMSSYLFKELREKNGVAYEVGVHHPIREREAPFILHASTTEDKALKTLLLLNESLKKISTATLSESELDLAISKYKGQIAHSIQTASQRAEKNAYLKGFNLPKDHQESLIGRLDLATKDRMQETALNFFKRPLISLCGREKTLNKLKEKWIEISY